MGPFNIIPNSLLAEFLLPSPRLWALQVWRSWYLREEASTRGYNYSSIKLEVGIAISLLESYSQKPKGEGSGYCSEWLILIKTCNLFAAAQWRQRGLYLKPNTSMSHHKNEWKTMAFQKSGALRIQRLQKWRFEAPHQVKNPNWLRTKDL